jgi:PAS domain S-box-containing protein
MRQTPDLSWLRQNESLDDSVWLLFNAVESARHGIIITDASIKDNPIIYSNPSFAELTGFEMSEILGQNCRFLQREDRQQPGLELVRAAIKDAQPVTALLRNYRKDGSMFWNELSISPVRDAHGKVVNFIGIQNDVTARLDAERRVSNFYSVISHELKTPLTAIHGALGAIEDGTAGKVSKTVERLVAIALDNCGRLMSLVEQILDWKKLEIGRFDIVKRTVEPGNLLTKLYEQLEPVAAKYSIDLRTELHTDRRLHCDPDRILQVLSNLTANAIKFSPAGETVVVRIVNAERDRTRFLVIDHGSGIAREERHKLFVHFQQVDSAEKRRSGGAGLGLAISKSIVELHNGTIGVDDTEGGGCSFWFELPPR